MTSISPKLTPVVIPSSQLREAWTTPIQGAPVQWIQIDNLSGGDLLEIHTESNSYLVAMSGTQRGLMVCSNVEVLNGEVSILGAWGDNGVPQWGTIRTGAGLLFAGVNEVGSATKTSPIVNLFLRKYIKSVPVFPASSTAKTSPSSPPISINSNAILKGGGTINPRPSGGGLKPIPRLGPQSALNPLVKSGTAGPK